MPAIAGEGFVLVDVAVFVVLLVLVAMLWLLVQARVPAGRLPVVGSIVTGAIDGLRGQIVTLFGQLGSFLDWQQAQVNHLWSGFINQVVAPLTNGLHALIASATLQLVHLTMVLVPQIQAELAQLSALTMRAILPALHLVQAELAIEQHLVQQVIAPDVAIAKATAALAVQELTQLRGQVEDLTLKLAQAELALAAVAGVIPLVHQLQALAAGAGSGVSVLERDVALQQARLGAIDAELARLLGLTGVAALGAVAIANLIRIARDPCNICPGLDLSNVQGRLLALELFGEV